jgi:hypothetical protein
MWYLHLQAKLHNIGVKLRRLWLHLKNFVPMDKVVDKDTSFWKEVK